MFVHRYVSCLYVCKYVNLRAYVSENACLGTRSMSECQAVPIYIMCRCNTICKVSLLLFEPIVCPGSQVERRQIV